MLTIRCTWTSRIRLTPPIATAAATAAPSMPWPEASGAASPTRTATASALSSRSSPVLPTMIRMNPTLPVAALISWPISRMRSVVSPVS